MTELDSMTLTNLFVEVEKQRRALKDQLADNERQRNALKEQLLVVFERRGIASIKQKGPGAMTVYISRQVAAKLVGNRATATAALKAYAPELVKETFNLNSLSALVREQMQEGGFESVEDLRAELPADLREVVDVVEWYDVRARQA